MLLLSLKLYFLSNPRERLDDFVNGHPPRNAGNSTNRKSNRQRQRGRMSEYQPSLGQTRLDKQTKRPYK